MFKHLYAVIFCLFIVSSTAYAESDKPALPTIEAETFDEEDFIFPEALKGQPISVVFLLLSSDREHGESQRAASIAWQQVLDSDKVLPENILAYHFPVMKHVPFFVRGMVVSSFSDAFEATVPANQSGMLFVDDLDVFAKENNFTVDQGPLILFISTEGNILDSLSGELSDQKLTEFKTLLNQNL
jgi:hypothetical protein